MLWLPTEEELIQSAIILALVVAVTGFLLLWASYYASSWLFQTVMWRVVGERAKCWKSMLSLSIYDERRRTEGTRLKQGVSSCFSAVLDALHLGREADVKVEAKDNRTAEALYVEAIDALESAHCRGCAVLALNLMGCRAATTAQLGDKKAAGDQLQAALSLGYTLREELEELVPWTSAMERVFEGLMDGLRDQFDVDIVLAGSRHLDGTTGTPTSILSSLLSYFTPHRGSESRIDAAALSKEDTAIWKPLSALRHDPFPRHDSLAGAATFSSAFGVESDVASKHTNERKQTEERIAGREQKGTVQQTVEKERPEHDEEAGNETFPPFEVITSEENSLPPEADNQSVSTGTVSAFLDMSEEWTSLLPMTEEERMALPVSNNQASHEGITILPEVDLLSPDPLPVYQSYVIADIAPAVDKTLSWWPTVSRKRWIQDGLLAAPWKVAGSVASRIIGPRAAGAAVTG